MEGKKKEKKRRRRADYSRPVGGLRDGCTYADFSQDTIHSWNVWSAAPVIHDSTGAPSAAPAATAAHVTTCSSLLPGNGGFSYRGARAGPRPRLYPTLITRSLTIISPTPV